MTNRKSRTKKKAIDQQKLETYIGIFKYKRFRLFKFDTQIIDYVNDRWYKNFDGYDKQSYQEKIKALESTILKYSMSSFLYLNSEEYRSRGRKKSLDGAGTSEVMDENTRGTTDDDAREVAIRQEDLTESEEDDDDGPPPAKNPESLIGTILCKNVA